MKNQLKKLPKHDGLGDIVLQEPDEDGDVSFYRQCLHRWSKEAQKEYEAENDKVYFGWCVTGANPIFGVSAWIVKED